MSFYQYRHFLHFQIAELFPHCEYLETNKYVIKMIISFFSYFSYCKYGFSIELFIIIWHSFNNIIIIVRSNIDPPFFNHFLILFFIYYEILHIYLKFIYINKIQRNFFFYSNNKILNYFYYVKFYSTFILFTYYTYYKIKLFIILKNKPHLNFCILK